MTKPTLQTPRPLWASLALAVVLALAVPSVSLAGSPTTQTLDSVDTALCGFPLQTELSQARTMTSVGSSMLFTGQSKLVLTNLVTGQTATLNTSGPIGFDGATGDATFTGAQVWSNGAPGVPYESTKGSGTLSPFLVVNSPRKASVIDPCALVGGWSNVTAAPTAAPWGLPADVLGQIGQAGLLPTLGTWIRIDNDHLDVVVNGQPVTVPAGVGLVEPVDGGPCWGPSNGDCATSHVFYPAIASSPLNTVSTSGIIHVDSDRPGVFTLGEFFDEWGVPLSQSCVGSYCTDGANQLQVYVNGTPVTGDPRAVVLGEHQEIAVVYGGSGAFGSVPSVYSGGWPDPSGGCGGVGEPSCIP